MLERMVIRSIQLERVSCACFDSAVRALHRHTEGAMSAANASRFVGRSTAETSAQKEQLRGAWDERSDTSTRTLRGWSLACDSRGPATVHRE